MGLGKMLTGLFKKERGDGTEEKRIHTGRAAADESGTEDMYITGTLDVPQAGVSSGETQKEKLDGSGEDGGERAERARGGKEADLQRSPGPAQVTEQKILEVLSQVYDPEIPIDIVNLGLIYGIEIEDTKVRIDMTMTAPGCPASTQIAAESKMLVEEIPGVESCEIEIVWDPPWDPSKMSEEAQQSMGIF